MFYLLSILIKALSLQKLFQVCPREHWVSPLCLPRPYLQHSMCLVNHSGRALGGRAGSPPGWNRLMCFTQGLSHQLKSIITDLKEESCKAQIQTQATRQLHLPDPPQSRDAPQAVAPPLCMRLHSSGPILAGIFSFPFKNPQIPINHLLPTGVFSS